MRLFALFVVVTADPARRELGKRKQGAKALAAMTKECRAVLSENNLDWLLEPFTCSARMRTSQTQLVLGMPAFRAIPISALNFCSYDGVLRGPFAFRRSADELKHSSVRSTDHK